MRHKSCRARALLFAPPQLARERGVRLPVNRVPSEDLEVDRAPLRVQLVFGARGRFAHDGNRPRALEIDFGGRGFALEARPLGRGQHRAATTRPRTVARKPLAVKENSVHQPPPQPHAAPIPRAEEFSVREPRREEAVHDFRRLTQSREARPAHEDGEWPRISIHHKNLGNCR